MTTIALGAYVFDCPDPAALARFYSALLDWSEPELESDWVTVRDPSGGPSLAFQLDPEMKPPTWPSRERHQMAHLDLHVRDLSATHERAVELGARVLEREHESFWVYADPAGHPFCLCLDYGPRGWRTD